MALKRYKANRRGSWNVSNVVSLGQLREPVAFIHAKKVPIDGTAGFEERVKPFILTHAAVDQGTYVRDRGQDADSQNQTVFVIRDEGQYVASDDFVVWGSHIYKVMGVQPIRGLNPFLEVSTAPYGEVSTAGFVVDDTLEVSETTDAGFDLEINSFWSDVNLLGYTYGYVYTEEGEIVADSQGRLIVVQIPSYSVIYTHDGLAIVTNDHKYLTTGIEYAGSGPSEPVLYPDEGYGFIETFDGEQLITDSGQLIEAVVLN